MVDRWLPIVSGSIPDRSICPVVRCTMNDVYIPDPNKEEMDCWLSGLKSSAVQSYRDRVGHPYSLKEVYNLFQTWREWITGTWCLWIN